MRYLVSFRQLTGPLLGSTRLASCDPRPLMRGAKLRSAVPTFATWRLERAGNDRAPRPLKTHALAPAPIWLSPVPALLAAMHPTGTGRRSTSTPPYAAHCRQ